MYILYRLYIYTYIIYYTRGLISRIRAAKTARIRATTIWPRQSILLMREAMPG